MHGKKLHTIDFIYKDFISAQKMLKNYGIITKLCQCKLMFLCTQYIWELRT